MPIAIRFLVFMRPSLGIVLRVRRIEPPARRAEASKADLQDALSKRVPSRLMRDVLPD